MTVGAHARERREIIMWVAIMTAIQNPHNHIGKIKNHYNYFLTSKLMEFASSLGRKRK